MNLNDACRVGECTQCLPILMDGLMRVVFLTSDLRFLIQRLTFYVVRITRAFLRRLRFFFLLITSEDRFSVQLRGEILVGGRPIVFYFKVGGECLRVNYLLAYVGLHYDGRVVSRGTSFYV